MACMLIMFGDIEFEWHGGKWQDDYFTSPMPYCYRSICLYQSLCSRNNSVVAVAFLCRHNFIHIPYSASSKRRKNEKERSKIAIHHDGVCSGRPGKLHV